MLIAVLNNKMAWFDREENENARLAVRLTLDANNVRSVIMPVSFTVGFVLQWPLALVLFAVFPIVVATTVLQVCVLYRH